MEVGRLPLGGGGAEEPAAAVATVWKLPSAVWLNP